MISPSGWRPCRRRAFARSSITPRSLESSMKSGAFVSLSVAASTFGHVGKPFLSYRQRTTADDDGRPMHAETGYLRAPSPGRVELVLAHPTGVTEVAEGTLCVRGSTIEMELAATTIGRTASAKEVTALSRSIRVDGDVLSYIVHMGAVGHPLQQHLTATLHRKHET